MSAAAHLQPVGELADDAMAGGSCSLADVRHLAVIPVWSEVGPSAAALLSLSRSAAFRATAAGEIPHLRIGSRVMVPVPALRRLLGDLPEHDAAGSARSLQSRDMGVTPEGVATPIPAQTPPVPTSTTS